MHLLVVGLLALAAGQGAAASQAHRAASAAMAGVCALVYAVGPLTPRVRSSRRAAALWLACFGVCWLVLLSLCADGVWVAFPLYFLELHLLPRRTGLAAVCVTALAAIAGFAAHQSTFAVAMVIGPALGAAVAVAVVWGYQALYRESEYRRRLIEQLTETRADLARAEHAAGVLAERERLAREIHDTLAQGLSSIQLLLRAAERALPARPGNAAQHIEQARHTAVDNLAEARRFVAALAPPALEDTTLADALERLCATTAARHGLDARFRHVGDPRTLPTSAEVALLRIAQSALANTVTHAHATEAEITLEYGLDDAAVRIGDDGGGFDPRAPRAPAADGGGFGLAAMRARLRELGGTLTLDTAPGRGTVLTARLPAPAVAPPAVPATVPAADPETHP
jgi:signal transduction histidine kinase